jgi:hypothetical protein
MSEVHLSAPDFTLPTFDQVEIGVAVIAAST